MKRDSKTLVKLFETLDTERQNSLLDYAEYLQSKGGPVKKAPGKPLDIPRPESESVVGAIKRLKQSYHMVDSIELFARASNLMTDHMVKGRDAEEVINEIEALFEETYQKMFKDFE